MWKQCRECLEQFWRRLVKEHTPTLRTRSKYHKSFDQLKERDVVRILQNKSPRGQWTMGLVERPIRGPDGEIRSCYLKRHQLLSYTTSSYKTLTPNNRQRLHKYHHHPQTCSPFT